MLLIYCPAPVSYPICRHAQQLPAQHNTRSASFARKLACRSVYAAMAHGLFSKAWLITPQLRGPTRNVTNASTRPVYDSSACG